MKRTTYSNWISALLPRFMLLARLAWKDITHEKMLSLCLVVSLAGLVAPILVLFGLKFGVIHTLQSELIEDPVNRELKPKETKLYDQEFFSKLRAMPEVEFVVESVTQGASVIRIDTTDGLTRLADLLPTAEGDPLLRENNTNIPAKNEAVLSESLANEIGVDVHDLIVLSAQRVENGEVYRVDTEFMIVGILPARGDVLERIYVPKEYAIEVESFREGFAVPSRGWSGRDRGLVPAYFSIIFSIDRSISATEQSKLTVNSDFFLIDELSSLELTEKLGLPIKHGFHYYQISVIDRLANRKSIERVSTKLNNMGANTWLWNPPVNVEIDMGGNEWVPVVLLPNYQILNSDESTNQTSELDVMFSLNTTKSVRIVGSEPSLVELRAAVNRGDTSVNSLNKIKFRISSEKTHIHFTFENIELVPTTENVDNEIIETTSFVAHVHPGLLGQLTMAATTPIQYDDALGKFERTSVGSRGFRIFARSIYDVSAIDEQLNLSKVYTHSAVQSITRLKSLDKGLTSLFLLIATAGLITSAVVLISNQISSVRRKRETLAQVRLLGLSKLDVSIMPLISGMYLSLFGALAGIGIAVFTAWVINRFLAQSLGFEKAMCVITFSHIAIAMVCVFVLTGLSSLFGALSTVKVDPAEGMRYE